MNNWWLIVIILWAISITSLIISFYLQKDNMDKCEKLASFSALCFLISICILIIIIICSSVYKEKYCKFKVKYQLLTQIIENTKENSYENEEITKIILEYNNWLADVKERKEIYGNWSFYTNIPVEELDYIGVVRK